jgi:hypothetical protein
MNKITPTWYLLYDFQWLPEKRLLTPKQEDVIYKFYKTPKNSETFDLEEDIEQSTEHKLVFKFSSFSFAGKGRVKAMIKDVQVWVPRTL